MDRTAEPVTSAHDPGLLAAYVEGRLDDDERRAMTEHLASCTECRQALAMMARAPGVRPQATGRRLATPSPIWLGLAATVVLATLAVRRTDAPVPVGEVRPPSIAAVSPAPTAPRPEVLTATPTTSSRPADPMLDPGLLVKRGASQRHVGARTFRLVAGEWVDVGFDPAVSLPTTLIKGPAERDATVKRLPALQPYAALGDRVIVVLDGVVYRFTP
jgi:anti-sigma factor RsiW